MRVEPVQVCPRVVVFRVGEEGEVDVVDFGCWVGWGDVSEE